MCYPFELPTCKDFDTDPDRDVHTTHCCILHGCKYGNSDCPVENGTKVQNYICEDCDYQLEESKAQIKELTDDQLRYIINSLQKELDTRNQRG